MAVRAVCRRRRERGRRRGDGGATLLFVVLVLPALMGMAAIAVDLAGARSDSVVLQAAADAGALSAVPDLPSQAGGSTTAAVSAAIEYATSNLSDDAAWTACATTTADTTCRTDGNYRLLVTTPYSVGTSVHAAHQRVRVEVCRRSREAFASATGLTSPTVCRSAVGGASSGSLGGLRPFGVCAEANDQIAGLVVFGTVPTSPVQIAYGKSDLARCGTSVPGNWGLIDFDGGSNSNADTQDWVADGYPGSVTAGTAGLTCPADTSGCYPGDTGAISNSLASGLSSLVASGEVFGLPIFDSLGGTGANSRFHIIGFVSVRLTDYRVTGAQAGRYLTVEVVSPGLIDGPECCQSGTALEG